MKYISTRGDRTERGFSEILLEGLAPDGGLYLPVAYPRIDDATLTRWRGLRYADLAFEILSLYIDDIPAADLRRLVDETMAVLRPQAQFKRLRLQAEGVHGRLARQSRRQGMCGGVGMQGVDKRLLPPRNLGGGNPPVAEGNNALRRRCGNKTIASEVIHPGKADAAQVGGRIAERVLGAELFCAAAGGSARRAARSW